MKTRLVKGIRGYLAAGLLFLVPVVLTFYVVVKLFFWLDGILNRQVSYLIFNFLGKTPSHPIPGVGLLALLLILLLTGIAVRNFLGRQLVKLSDFILSRIPLVGHIYSTLQQIGHAFLSEKSETFKRAVLFEYPRHGLYSIGFITQDTKGLIQQRLFDHQKEDCYSVFLPTTPNPTSGFLLFVPKVNVIELNMSVEEALKLIISGGSIVPFEKSEELLSSPKDKSGI
ncbi:DUF502 domain-containing protein [candidate division KSB1 bacterium]|nr:DUF502 domain-containing protein [candidate division KSB1 bacterium]RQW07170.1 MAG: DUF502 domain-containing protein [candidate division KSB1 bacterium]